MRRPLLALALVTIALGCGYLLLPFGLTVNYPGVSGAPLPPQDLQRRITLPPGFSISTYASGIPSARFMCPTSRGDLLVSSPAEGKIYLVQVHAEGDGAADQVRVLLSNLNRPHGLDLYDGWLYVAEGDAILRVRFDESTGQVAGAPERIVRGLPQGGNHWTRTVRVGPDGWLYVSVGSSCNVCVEKDPRRAAILRYRLDGSGEEIYATGLRNSVGFDWQPGTGALFATDNGRDLLGDDFPPCELNRIVQGGFYGWPVANGDRVPDPDEGKGQQARIDASIPPEHGFAAHTAPLGMTFYTGTAFPERYRGAAFVAQHGSWNRSRKSGYEVVALFFEDGAVREEDFATGFMIDEKVSGRPVDVAVARDGALYVSDDYTGSIYRIAYGEASRSRAAAAGPGKVVPQGDPLAALDVAARAAATERGRALFDTMTCATCHVEGKQAKDGAYKPLEQLARKYTLDSLAAFLAAPQPPMPLFPLSESERRDLSVYLLAEHG